MGRNNPATKSAKKSCGSKIKIAKILHCQEPALANRMAKHIIRFGGGGGTYYEARPPKPFLETSESGICLVSAHFLSSKGNDRAWTLPRLILAHCHPLKTGLVAQTLHHLCRATLVALHCVAFLALRFCSVARESRYTP